MNSGTVTFGEAKCVYCQSMKELDWVLGNDSVDELYEYKNPGIVKNYRVSQKIRSTFNLKQVENDCIYTICFYSF